MSVRCARLIVALGLVGASLVLLARGAEPAKKEYKGKPAGRMVHYTGAVQGVGFRATARDIARGYPVTGWVKNLADGRVQLLVEGPADAVEDFLQAVRSRWKDNIKKERAEERKPRGKYRDFSVAY